MPRHLVEEIDLQICRLLALRQRLPRPDGYSPDKVAKAAGIDPGLFSKLVSIAPAIGGSAAQNEYARCITDSPASQSHMARLLINNAFINRSSAWTNEERNKFGLRGLLPPRVNTIDEQMERVKHNFDEAGSQLQKYKYLASLQDRNETLFYKFLVSNVEETFPIVYTPTVGEACEKFSRIFATGRGLYVTHADKGRIADILANWHEPDVRVIVVTDGERILGLGDLGANGMGIPIGKLSLYCACAGIKPWKTLPITLDVGCDNDAVRNDEMYNGLPQKRIKGAEYMAFVDEFISAVKARWPTVLLQWEDFGVDNAYAVLSRYRKSILSFNDDIQGTATIVLAAIRTALRVTKKTLGDQRILFYGAGSSATGVAELIASAVALEELIPMEEARKRCIFMDRTGIVCRERTEEVSGTKGGVGLLPHKLPFCHDLPWIKDLAEAIEQLKPTALMGLSTTGGAFDEKVLTTMDRVNAASRPIIFALSNPTRKCECTAEDAYKHTKGRALFASGSPFDAVTYDGKEHWPRQANNAYIFPGLGLGLVLAKATGCPDELFHVSAKACADAVDDQDLFEHGALCPRLANIREVSATIATAVVHECVKQGLARNGDIPKDPKGVLAWVKSKMWDARYQPIPQAIVDYLSIR